MSTHYETLPHAETYREAFAVDPPEALGERHLWPRKPGFFIVHATTAAAISQPTVAKATTDVETHALADAPTEAPESNTERVLIPAQWGLVPHWVKSASDAKLRAPKLVNAKSDTASTGTAFRDAWLGGQRCIVPMAAFYEDDLRSGKAVPTRIARVDGKPMGVAGLWARWQGSDGEVIVSYCLLTVNANNHALLHRYGQPGSEKSMPAILNEGAYDAWLTARPEKAKEFMRQYAANWLLANPVEKKSDKVPKGLLG
ncbi:SOS response-associated peptidase [Acidovorax sp. ACV01]|uniref:SOS response-associated peptidase n=1 Tax=Acidovorax sp. ACV01 TaxID=2769311 RepID=UPI00177F3517|nr:SOS response-associated peptidase family protein [Acidovorax sp. ACV01]MBD9392870.1 SOS response-associated peptidase [Acidovorax sp. ACV01]